MIISLFLLGLLLVVIGSNAFVDSSIRIARRYHISELLIGATLVSVGTTLPELIVSTTASVQGHSDMAIGNAIGSIICNTALVAGLVQLLCPSKIDGKTFRKNSLEFIVAAIIFCGFLYPDKMLARPASLILLTIFFIGTYQSIRQAKLEYRNAPFQATSEHSFSDFPLMALAATALAFGAQLLVRNGSLLAAMIGIPEHVISISMIALGTSLPELLTSLTALKKGSHALSIGNILGANILNLLVVSGASGVIKPIPTTDTILCLDIPIMLLVSAILIIPGLIYKKLYRVQGILLLCIYVFYMLHLYGVF